MSKEQIIAIIVVIFILIRTFIIEPNAIEVKNYEIEDRALANVKIVFFSDLHLRKSDYKRLDKIIKLINDQKPDIVINGGDYAPSRNYKEMMDPDTMATKISLIDAPVFTVLGEYDWYANGQEIAKSLQKNGIKVLENSAARTAVNRRYINIVGYADATTRTIKAAKAARGTSKPRILVTHNPDVYYNIMDEYNLILAGHTHGGQIVIPFTPPIISSSKYKFNKGIVKPGMNTMLITKGLGTTGLKGRFNCKPEIVVINFVKNSTKNTR